jgi:branched-chain amino acid transport system permease protein
MNAFIAYTISGLANGAIYALVALGAILIFKGSRVANFAHGEIGTVSAFLLYALVPIAGLAYWLGAVVALVGAALIAVLIERTIVRKVTSTLFVLVGTLGVSNLLTGLNSLLWADGEPYELPPLATPPDVRVGGVGVSGEYVLNLAVLLAVVLVLYLVVERTPLGLTIRASAEDAELAELAGVNVRLRVVAIWACGGALAGLAALLLAPLGALTISLMLPLLFKGYSAGIIGGLESLPGGVVGGLVLGLLESYLGGYVSSEAQDALVYVVVIAVLVIRPAGLFGRTRLERV